MGYLTTRWEEGAEFSSVLSDSRDFSESYDVPREVFTPMVIGHLFFAPPRPAWLGALLEAISPLVAAGEPIHFFQQRDLLPADVDCTALGYSLAAKTLRVPRDTLRSVAMLVAQNVTSEGLIQVYFDPNGSRDGLVDPVVCVNALTLCNLAGVVDLDTVGKTERRVVEYLNSDAFLAGSRYYPSPETFLYFLSRLVSAHPLRYGAWAPIVRAKLKQRQGVESRPLELAQRVLAATALGVDASLDVWHLRRSQAGDGSYPPDAFFKYGRRAKYFGGKFVTTAFAARALADYGRRLRTFHGELRSHSVLDEEMLLGLTWDKMSMIRPQQRVEASHRALNKGPSRFSRLR